MCRLFDIGESQNFQYTLLLVGGTTDHVHIAASGGVNYRHKNKFFEGVHDTISNDFACRNGSAFFGLAVNYRKSLPNIVYKSISQEVDFEELKTSGKALLNTMSICNASSRSALSTHSFASEAMLPNPTRFSTTTFDIS